MSSSQETGDVDLQASYFFRGMKTSEDGFPEVGDSANHLGVRDSELHLDKYNHVHPGCGMSVFINEPDKLPGHRRPRWLEGTARFSDIFSIQGRHVPSKLKIVHSGNSDPYHYQFEPPQSMPLTEYRSAIASSRPSWKRISSMHDLRKHREETA